MPKRKKASHPSIGRKKKKNQIGSQPSDGSHGELSEVYHSPSHPSAYSSAERLRQGTKKTPKQVQSFLEGEHTYTLHAPARRHFPRNVTYADNVDDCWQSDLTDFRSIKEDNDDFVFILCVIDVFSKYAWCVPLKSKTAKCIIDGFKTIFSSTSRRCTKLITDKGKEYDNVVFKKFLKSHDIEFYHTNNPDTKASVCERFQKSMKDFLFRRFTHTEDYCYIGGLLDDFLRAYNNRFHRMIKMTPTEASSPKRVLEVYENLYGHGQLRKPKRKATFGVGDYCRISREKKRFEKGYTWNWSEEIFKVIKVIPHAEPVYHIQDLSGDPIEGHFYSYELKKVSKPEIFKIAYILETKGKGDSRRHLVHWRGYPVKSRSWVLDKDIIQS